MRATHRLVPWLAPGILLLSMPGHASAQAAVERPQTRLTPQTSTSASGQFVIHGTDLATRGAFCLLCDDIASALGRLLRDDARWSLPIVIVLKAPPDAPQTGPAVAWNISQLAHGGFHLQLNGMIRGDFRGDDFARELVRLLLAERILRNHKELKTSRQNVLPNWVLTGVTQALEFRGRSRPSALFAAVFRAGQVYSVDHILSADPAQLDALNRGIYETSACAMVLALLEQQDGPIRFARFLNALARENKADRDLLRQHFPTLGASKNSLEKWWTLQMATLSTLSPLETLGVQETENKLNEALTLVAAPLKESGKKKSESKPAPPKATEPAAAKKAEISEPKAEESRRSIFSAPGAGTLLGGGRKILFVPADDTNTDGAPAKTAPKKAGTGDAKAKPDPAPPPAEPPKKGTKWNPLNWFRKDPKPAPEEPKTPETPGKTPEKSTEKTPPPEPAKKRVEEKRSNPAPAKSAEPAAPAAQILRAPIEEFGLIWKRPDREKILQRNLDQLNALKLQAHPLYRPLLSQYISTIRQLMTGKQKGVPEKLAELARDRARIRDLSLAVETHLDWYEASQTRGYSGSFDDYLKLRDKLDKENRARNDAISRYLDSLAREYSD